MEAQTTLVRSKSRVELNTKTTVDTQIAAVVLPDNTELDNSLRNRGNFKGCAVLGVAIEECAVVESALEL